MARMSLLCVRTPSRPTPAPAAGEPISVAVLSMCSSSKSNTCARKGGTRRLSLSRAEHASQQAVSVLFLGSCAFVFACLASCQGPIVFPRGGVGGGGRGTISLAMFPRGCGDTVMGRRVLIKVGGWTTLVLRGRLKRSARAVQLFGRLAAVETRTLWYFGHHCCLVVGFDALGIWHFGIFTLFHPFLLFCTHFLPSSTTSTLFLG